MPDRFIQIVVTKKADDKFHITWQDEKSVVRSEYPGFVDAQAMVIDALSNIDFAEPERRFIGEPD